MDCCNYGEFRGHGQYAAAWDGYGYALPYGPYTHGYYASHAHDPYARYYRFDYGAPHVQPHSHHTEHPLPMDYGVYASKESRVRRTLSRREQRVHPPVQHLPIPHTPPLECGITGRNRSYCEPQMWPHHQMGVLGGGGWNGANVGGVWATRAMCSREQMRYVPSDCRMMKGPHLNYLNPLCPPEGRSTPYPVYEDSSYGSENVKHSGQRDLPMRSVAMLESIRPMQERTVPEPRRSPLEEKRPPIVPLPAFQQAFGSTEIGKFAEAFSRTEVALEGEDVPNDNFVYESFHDWDGSTDGQWASQPATREIKCEENY